MPWSTSRQTIAETLLFYHPAVWWVSSRIRTEREHCCDDVALAVSGDAYAYASALAELESWRVGAARCLAMAATGGPLLRRVARVLAPPAAHSPRGGIVLTLALALVLVVGCGALQLSRRAPAGTGRARTPATRGGVADGVRSSDRTDGRFAGSPPAISCATPISCPRRASSAGRRGSIRTRSI